ncbi:MAG: GNAT family N-acetyltransferase [SAR202 cluster bacterium]|nr:hypothetical protein [Chloroflexota bacterium]MQG22381.1 GNAT family N-acetyltransferase [SAR202 cluster bacterium]
MFKKNFSWFSNNQKELPDVDLFGDLVHIREKEIEDIADEYSWRTDEELSRLDATRPLTMSYDDFFRYSKEEMKFPNYKSKKLALDTKDNIHIGNVMYYDYSISNKQTELGIMIGDKNYWGKGYGTEAVQLLLEYLFSVLNLKRVYLHTLSWNYRAQASFIRAGFNVVRSVRRGGHDFILMEVIESDWGKSNTL